MSLPAARLQEPGLKLQESLADRLRKEDSALDAAMADVAALQARLKDAAKKLQQVQPELLQASRTIRSLSVMDGTAELIKENARRSLDTAQAVLTDAGSLLAALEGSGALRQVAVPYGLLAGLGQEAAQTAASNSQLADSYRQLAADLEAPVAAARIAAAAAAQANVAALEASLASVTANANAAASKAAEALAEMTDQRDAMVLQYNQLLPGVAGQQAALAAARAEAEVAVAAQAALTAERHALARENAELTTRCNAAAAKETAQAKAAADLTAERDSWKAKYDELAAKPAEQEARGTSPRHGLLQLKKQGRLATDLGLGQH
jgi:chromosome segregation ATPase